MVFYIEDSAKPSYKNVLWASQKNFHTSTSKAEHLQDLHARTFEGGFEQDLHKIFSQGPAQDISRTSYMISAISKIFTRSPHKDLHKILHGPLMISARSSHKDLLCKQKPANAQKSTVPFTFRTWTGHQARSTAIVPREMAPAPQISTTNAFKSWAGSNQIAWNSQSRFSTVPNLTSVHSWPEASPVLLNAAQTRARPQARLQAAGLGSPPRTVVGSSHHGERNFEPRCSHALPACRDKRKFFLHWDSFRRGYSLTTGFQSSFQR